MQAAGHAGKCRWNKVCARPRRAGCEEVSSLRIGKPRRRLVNVLPGCAGSNRRTETKTAEVIPIRSNLVFADAERAYRCPGGRSAREQPPREQPPREQPPREQPPRIGFCSALDDLLAENAAKPARERLTLIRVFETLRDRGYDGGYDAVRRYARRWRRERDADQTQAYVPLRFAPGEAYQFDWSHEIVVLAGVTTQVKVAHLRLCHSRMPFIRAYPREGQEMLFDAHAQAFAWSCPAWWCRSCG